ncbi:MAG: ABC transporter substrate-binding protein [Methanosarcinaceae archaeon]
MNKGFLFAMTTSLLLVLVLPVAASGYTIGIFGNANSDCTINAEDITYTERIILGLNEQSQLADAKYDNKVDVLDITQIEQIILGNEKKLTFIDNAERTVTVDKPIERIVMLSTDSAEVVRSLGGINKIVGVTTHIAKDTIFFPDIALLPTVGSAFHPDWEMLLSLDPEIVFAYTSALAPKYFGDTLKTLDIPIGGFSNCKLLTRDVQLRKQGHIIGKIDRAGELINFYHDCTDSIETAVEEITVEEKPRVYIECYSDYKARTSRSGTHSMCEMAGGINIGADLSEKGTTTTVDPEWIIDRNPDIIIKVVSGSKVSSGYDEDDPAKMKAVKDTIISRPGFDGILAVQNDRVYLISTDICDRSCNSIGVAYMAKWFHPNLFEEINPQALHQEYIDDFCGIAYDLNEHGVFVYPPIEKS